IPPSAGTTLTITGEQAVLDSVNRVENAIRGLLGFGPIKLNLAPQTAPGHAAGGDVFGGATGLLVPVGEKGPETLFIPPGVGGRVFTAQETRNGVGGGPVVGELHIHEVAGSPEATGFVAAREIGIAARRG